MAKVDGVTGLVMMVIMVVMVDTAGMEDMVGMVQDMIIMEQDTVVMGLQEVAEVVEDFSHIKGVSIFQNQAIFLFLKLLLYFLYSGIEYVFFNIIKPCTYTKF